MWKRMGDRASTVMHRSMEETSLEAGLRKGGIAPEACLQREGCLRNAGRGVEKYSRSAPGLDTSLW